MRRTFGDRYSVIVTAVFSVAIFSLPAFGGERHSPPASLQTRRQGSELERTANATEPSRSRIFVVNAGNPPASVSIYRADANGNIPPTRTIIGAKTELLYSAAISLDARGQIYVANQAGFIEPSSITIFAPRTKGNQRPIRMISGDRTGLDSPDGVAVDSSGRIYVSNFLGYSYNRGSVLVYPPNADGNVSPIATIVGPNTELNAPSGVALDSSGNIYVANGGATTGPYSVTVYPAGANGNFHPLRVISGFNTGLAQPSGPTLDSRGNLYVANAPFSGPATITEYAAGANGNVAPIRMIAGSSTQLYTPVSVALDPENRIYVANVRGGYLGFGDVTVYDADANGDAAPIQDIDGSNTDMSEPSGLVVR